MLDGLRLKLLFLTGMMPTAGGSPQFLVRVGAKADADPRYRAAQLAALNAIAFVKERLGSLDHVQRIVRLAVDSRSRTSEI